MTDQKRENSGKGEQKSENGAFYSGGGKIHDGQAGEKIERKGENELGQAGKKTEKKSVGTSFGEADFFLATSGEIARNKKFGAGGFAIVDSAKKDAEGKKNTSEKPVKARGV